MSAARETAEQARERLNRCTSVDGCTRPSLPTSMLCAEHVLAAYDAAAAELDETADDGPCCEHDDDEHGADGCYHQERVSGGWALCPCAQPRRDMTPTRRDATRMLLSGGRYEL